MIYIPGDVKLALAQLNEFDIEANYFKSKNHHLSKESILVPFLQVQLPIVLSIGILGCDSKKYENDDQEKMHCLYFILDLPTQWIFWNNPSQHTMISLPTSTYERLFENGDTCINWLKKIVSN